MTLVGVGVTGAAVVGACVTGAAVAGASPEQICEASPVGAVYWPEQDDLVDKQQTKLDPNLE